MNKDSAVLNCSHLGRQFKEGGLDVTVLRDVSLTINTGERVAIVGQSGSGKSTLLHLLGGLDRPTGGTVTVGGAELSSMSNNQLSGWRSSHVGFVFQFYNLLPVLTAQKNVELPLLLTNFSSKERADRAAIALDIVGLSDRARHMPKELSGGEEQRVAIARAIVSDPTLLLCDEPTGDLDRETADEILELMQILNREHGKTIVMVTHDAQAAEFASRTLHVDKGKLESRAAA